MDAPTPHVHEALLFVPGLGKATRCSGYSGHHRPTPMRYVWHHVLPQVAAGKTEPANLVELCDGCHLAVHAILFRLVALHGDTSLLGRYHGGTPAQRYLAKQGYDAAVAAGTVDRIPNEGGIAPV